ncbi:PWWP domain-containing DNA repair factor 3A-like isoform X2 [Denticeps clupeoides]|uniref:PWWP domain-containing DNA repair factor 3A-like isoform X2 n=1 Tax=Denticeps clupeoides TaxID=299321 RepID=UPI0010A357F8|nr:PWWP domain-containing DNA repair factor 3A-like isoform X2 [Denticeps clupeoides]
MDSPYCLVQWQGQSWPAERVKSSKKQKLVEVEILGEQTRVWIKPAETSPLTWQQIEDICAQLSRNSAGEVDAVHDLKYRKALRIALNLLGRGDDRTHPRPGGSNSAARNSEQQSMLDKNNVVLGAGSADHSFKKDQHENIASPGPHLVPDLQTKEEDSFACLMQRKPFSIRKEICVWCKYRSPMFLPAFVKRVMHKQEKANVVFVEDLFSSNIASLKSLSNFPSVRVPFSSIKPFDCEDSNQLMCQANKKQGANIGCCIELVKDYSICIGSGSFCGSFLEYFSNDISLPVKMMHMCGSSHPPSTSDEVTEVISPQQASEDTFILLEDSMDNLSKHLLSDHALAARHHVNEQLVQFIVLKRGAEKHLQAIISGRKSSKWLKAFFKPTHTVGSTYFDDEQQVDRIFMYLWDIYARATEIPPCLLEQDTVRFVLDVLLPEAVIYGLVKFDGMSRREAEAKYLQLPAVSWREKKEFDMMIATSLQNTKEKNSSD